MKLNQTDSAKRKPKFTFFKKSVFYLLFGLLCHSCYNIEENDRICILNCNPEECLILDEENCECVIDRACLAEKFCDGDIEDCKCKEEDGGSWCEALTGDSIKVWFLYTRTDSLIWENIGTNYNSYFDRKRGDLCIYRLDHIYREPGIYENNFGPFTSSWEFDNVIYPKKIIYKHIQSSEYPPYDYYEELEIVRLTPDTLILSYYNESKKAWLICIPEFERRLW